ncbi:AAA family ATPase [Gemmobacter denitrificans]|uniref:AAA family ATPase n=1 Tax=Gemmobacter denitrificans TaxID=3123040 RepID=A0ABU8BVK4_9RHOB
MYLQRLELRNTGPIEEASVECRFNDDGTPKPIVFVGRNGSGKSIATAHVVSALIAAHGAVFEDSDVEAGKVYKLRSPFYVRNGAEFSLGEVYFSDDYFVSEAQFLKSKKDYAEPFPNYGKWDEVDPSSMSHYTSNFRQRPAMLKEALNNATHLFFPPNRFEEPAWLNDLNLRNKVSYGSLKNFDTFSNRPVVNYAPMRNLQSWLLDLIYDSYAIERKSRISQPPAAFGYTWVPKVIETREGRASRILDSISHFLTALLGKQGTVTWSVGARNNRQIGILIDNQLVTQNLFQLSTGQAVLLDLFLTIIRDFDLSHAPLNQLSDIEGIVVIDEIDLHLHTDIQHDILPNLIGLFPRVQFILTTHSPLFLIGMEKAFAVDGFQIIELPSGKEIEVERFSEFEVAYERMRESARFEEEVRSKVEASQKPMLYVEGMTDIDYLNKAAELLGRHAIINRFELVDAVGVPHLNMIWKTYSSHLGTTLRQKWVLLYDCDADKPADNNGKLFRRTIPKQESRITSGIENLFTEATIKRAIAHKAAFIDIIGEHEALERGVRTMVPETWKINKDEKRNLCDWLCKHGNQDDFQRFGEVFDILEGVLSFGE